MKEEITLMPRQIVVGDKVRLNPKRSGVYTRRYGNDLLERVWTVSHIDKTTRKRLYVGDTPTAIYASDAVLAYPMQSKTRRDQLQWDKK